MAYSSAALASWETTALGKDYPLLVSQMIPTSPSVAEWTENAACDAGADRTHASYPASRGYDGLPHLDARPDATAASTWYYWLDLGSGQEIDLDCAFIIGHNFGSLVCTGCTLEIADDNDFSVNLLEVASFTSQLNTDDDRLYDLTMGGGNNRYSSVRYVRVKVTRGTNFTPQIGELVLGRRRQMFHMPIGPFDPTSLHDDSAIARSMTGVLHRFTYHRKRFDLLAEFMESQDTYINNLISFYDDCRGPFVWMYKPNTVPATWHLMSLDSNDFNFPSSGGKAWTDRTVEISATEQGSQDYFMANE